MRKPILAKVGGAFVIAILFIFLVSCEGDAQHSTTQETQDESSSVFEFIRERPIPVFISALSIAIWVSLAVRIIRTRENLAERRAERRAAVQAESGPQRRAERRAQIRGDIADSLQQVVDLASQIIKKGVAPAIFTMSSTVTHEVVSSHFVIVNYEKTIESYENTLAEYQDVLAKHYDTIIDLQEEINQAVEKAIRDGSATVNANLIADTEDIKRVEQAVSDGIDSMIEVVVTSIKDEIVTDTKAVIEEFLEELSSLYAIQPILRPSLPGTFSPTQEPVLSGP